MSRTIFGTDGIRGRAGIYPVTPDAALQLGRALSIVLGGAKRRRVLVGRDTRISGDMLEAALVAGLTSAGIDVLLAGVIPTPAAAALTRQLEADAAIALSASHNPFDDNGIKFFTGEGLKLGDEAEAAIEEAFLATEDVVPRAVGGDIGRCVSVADAAEFYIEGALARFPGDFRLDGVCIAFDGANGAGAFTTPSALRRLGADVRVFHAEPDGLNINEKCGSTHPETLRELVLKTGASIGIAHDGDADRVIFADETGEILDGDEFLAIVGTHMLARGELRNEALVATVLSNYGLDEAISAAGGKVIRSAVGDRNVAEDMIRNDLILGGEQSGHFILRDLTTTGDGLMSALRLLQILRSENKPLSEMRRVMRKFPQTSVNVRVVRKPPLENIPGYNEVMQAARAALEPKGRILVRYSGTESLVRILAEGPDRELTERHAGLVADLLKRELAV